MQTPNYREWAFRSIRHALDKCEEVAPISHRGTKGRLRELFVQDLLKPHLPAGLRVSTGIVVDHRGMQSGQEDIVVFDTSVMPPVLEQGEVVFVPIEATLAVIEVKSVLDQRAIQQAQSHATVIKSMALLTLDASSQEKPLVPRDLAQVRGTGTYHEDGTPRSCLTAGWVNPLARFWPNYFLLGLKKQVAIEHLVLPDMLSTVCVAEPGFSISGRVPGVSSWLGWSMDCSQREEAVAGFLAAVFEQSRSVAQARQELNLPHVYRYFGRAPGFRQSSSASTSLKPSPEQLQIWERLRAERLGDQPNPLLPHDEKDAEEPK